MNNYDTDLYPRVTGLKQFNAGLKVYISVGGWAAGGAIFSTMTASSASRSTFIKSAVQFMDTYGFDGIDIDWEYPAASDRGGNSADTKNFVTFLQELKAAIGGKGLTATLPSSYWYMQGFDVVGMEQYVDWFNFMSYDIHGKKGKHLKRMMCVKRRSLTIASKAHGTAIILTRRQLFSLTRT